MEKPYWINGDYNWYIDKKYQNYLETEQAENLPKLTGLGVFRVVNEKESIDDFWFELEECKDNFDFLRQLTDGSINKSDWEECDFDGDFESLFNDYLEQLYDVADTKITLRSGEVEKLLWIG